MVSRLLLYQASTSFLQGPIKLSFAGIGDKEAKLFVSANRRTSTLVYKFSERELVRMKLENGLLASQLTVLSGCSQSVSAQSILQGISQ